MYHLLVIIYWLICKEQFSSLFSISFYLPLLIVIIYASWLTLMLLLTLRHDVISLIISLLFHITSLIFFCLRSLRDIIDYHFIINICHFIMPPFDAWLRHWLLRFIILMPFSSDAATISTLFLHTLFIIDAIIIFMPAISLMLMSFRLIFFADAW